MPLRVRTRKRDVVIVLRLEPKAAENERSNRKCITMVRDIETGAVMIRAKITDDLGVGNLTSA